MRSAGRRFFALMTCAAVLWGGACSNAFAADDFSGQTAPDMARAWLDLLFRGIKLPTSLAGEAPSLEVVASALHRALGVYSVSILVLAGLLLFYHLAVMIVETAHYGVPLGRRSAQVWAPIRLVLAIGFLVPVSSGLNAGQYLVTWMAEQGSSLASRAWGVAASEMKGSFSGIAMPHGPDVAGFVAGGFDMELCRNLYRRAFAVLPANSTAQLAGDIGDIEKLPRSRFAGEIWQYSNRLQAALPLCGAYRFTAARTSASDATIDRLNNEFADFSRAEADKLVAETQGIAGNEASVFLGETAGTGAHDDINALIASHQAALNEKLRALADGDDSGLIDRTFAASADAGWITAGGFLLEVGRLQQIYGTVAANALPAVEVPLLAQRSFLGEDLADTLAAESGLRALSATDIAPLTVFYEQTGRLIHRGRMWLYDRQLADMPLTLADSFDLRDEMTMANDPAAISSLFGHVLNDAAVANGVWNGPAVTSSIFANERTVLALPSTIQNPVTALTDFGQRQAALGNYLVGIAGPDVAPAGTLAHTLLLSAAGLSFIASGYALMFLVPLLPFIRFFVGILAWLLSVFEAVIAVPVVALVHLNLSGEGLSGGAARQAYLLFLNILIRPALTLFGLVMGLLLFTFAVAFLDLVFHELMHLAAPAGGDGFVTVNVALTLLYTVLAVAAANVSFKGITFLPEMALKWLGGFGTVERAEAPVAVANASATGAPGLPGYSPAALSAQRQGGLAARGGGIENRIITAAKSYGMALFPQYHGGEKSVTGHLNPLAAGMEKHERIASGSDTSRAAPVTVVNKLNIPRAAEKKPDKRRKNNTDNLDADISSGPDRKKEIPEDEAPPDLEADPS